MMLSAQEAQAMTMVVRIQKKKEAIEDVKDWCEKVMESKVYEAISFGHFDASARIGRDIDLSLTEIRETVKNYFEPFGYKVTVNDSKRVTLSW